MTSPFFFFPWELELGAARFLIFVRTRRCDLVSCELSPPLYKYTPPVGCVRLRVLFWGGWLPCHMYGVVLVRVRVLGGVRG